MNLFNLKVIYTVFGTRFDTLDKKKKTLLAIRKKKLKNLFSQSAIMIVIEFYNILKHPVTFEYPDNLLNNRQIFSNKNAINLTVKLIIFSKLVKF